ncbi:MAG: hypothetical protein JWM93_3810 [Frankiales bacterium]|nr:hypothetical protein [Frankiales bacterium]
MQPVHFSRRRSTLVGVTVLALAAAAASPAMAADSVTQVITGGSLSASIANVSLPSATYSHSQQTKSGSLTLTVDDSTGSDAGWNVTEQVSDFVLSGGDGSYDIPAANFALTSAGTPAMTAGQAVDGTDGPMVPSTSPVGALDSARKVIQANAGFGKGTYTQALGVTLTIPADNLTGTYTGTLTTTVTAAP